jgi:hypothetical protein
MRFIPTRVHGVLDYLTAAFLFVMPWALGFGSMWGETIAPMLVGLFVVCYSIVTAYEWGLSGILPMSGHLWIDFGTGIFLALSPWIFGFAEVAWLPHVIVGLFLMAVSVTTRTVPERVPAPPESLARADVFYPQ